MKKFLTISVLSLVFASTILAAGDTYEDYISIITNGGAAVYYGTGGGNSSTKPVISIIFLIEMRSLASK
jgi:hypothetical protein